MPDLYIRSASLAPSSVNREARTVEVIWSTGAPVVRRDFEGVFVELLDMRREAVDLGRMIGANVLDAHQQGQVRNVLGVVLAAATDGRQGTATLQISARPDVEPYWQDIQAGILRHVSVGYSVQEWREGTDAEGNRTRTATRWQPFEISFVPVPADAGAHVRKGDTMPDNIRAVEPAQPSAPSPEQGKVTSQNRAAANASIRSLAQAHGLDQSWIDAQIDAGADLTAARAAALDALAARSAKPIQTAQVGASYDDPAARIAPMAEALAVRAVPSLQPREQARPYMGRSMLGMAEELLAARGINARSMTRTDILARAMTTSDLPALLQGTGNRVLMAAYQGSASVVKTVAREARADDFRAQQRLRIGEMPKLLEVNEHGEVQSGSVDEEVESYKLKTYARMFSLTRQAIINDDLGAFSQWSAMMGKAAAETEADILVSLLTSNPALSDGVALFHASHGNLAGSGSAISVTSLSEARKAMRVQRGVDGATLAGMAPRYLMVSPDKETEAEQVLAALTASQVGDVNPFSGKLELLVEPRLTGNGWYLFADPAAGAALEYAYLSSAPGPQMTSREGWETLGMEMRVVLDFGAGAVDHRGAYRNAGA